MLEALKLYLNIKGCVYFLGLDRVPIELSITHQYKAFEDVEAGSAYLDKIGQLPFHISPIAIESMRNFVMPLLPDDLHSCWPILSRGLSPNPRQVKRFINTLTLNHLLATEAGISDYDPRVLAFALIIQLRSPPLYQILIEDPSYLKSLVTRTESTTINELIRENSYLPRVLEALEVRTLDDPAGYIYLTEIVGLDQTTRSIPEDDIRLSDSVNDRTLTNYTRSRYPDLPIDDGLQDILLKDLNRDGYKTLHDLEKSVNAARGFVDWHRGNHPDLFESATSYLTKSLGWDDPVFRKRHAFGDVTRNAYIHYENMQRGRSADEEE